MDKKTLQIRTKQFHVDVIKFCSDFPKNAAGFETAKQIIRSAGSVGANYRASARAKSKPDFINKIQIIIEEANELTAVFTATNKTAKANYNPQDKKS
ncbi:MAG: four helix bundle protein [Ferruginibacter sp.]